MQASNSVTVACREPPRKRKGGTWVSSELPGRLFPCPAGADPVRPGSQRFCACLVKNLPGLKTDRVDWMHFESAVPVSRAPWAASLACSLPACEVE